MPLRDVEYIDPDGRKWRRLIPADALDDEAADGIPAGPADLSSLGLPVDIEVRLHNALYNRGILTRQDAQLRGADVDGAIRQALKLDIARVRSCYED